MRLQRRLQPRAVQTMHGFVAHDRRAPARQERTHQGAGPRDQVLLDQYVIGSAAQAHAHAGHQAAPSSRDFRAAIMAATVA